MGAPCPANVNKIHFRTDLIQVFGDLTGFMQSSVNANFGDMIRKRLMVVASCLWRMFRGAQDGAHLSMRVYLLLRTPLILTCEFLQASKEAPRPLQTLKSSFGKLLPCFVSFALTVPHAGVETLLSKQTCMSATFSNEALVEHDYFVGFNHG
jgi:hypothetical protein